MTSNLSNLKIFIYYFSFVLLFAILTFIASMLMMEYEDRVGTLQWLAEDMRISDKAGLIIFYTLQFPLGLLFGVLTGNFHNGLFAILINPLAIGWVLNRTNKRSEKRHVKKIIVINYSICALIISIILIYIMTE